MLTAEMLAQKQALAEENRQKVSKPSKLPRK